MLDNPIFWTLPLSTWLIFSWFALACISTHNKRIWQAARAGELPEGDEQPPGCLAWVLIPQYAILVWLAMINWQQALSIYVITFLIATFLSLLMQLIGGILLVPFRLVQVAVRGGVKPRDP